jgi:hypothetical protein
MIRRGFPSEERSDDRISSADRRAIVTKGGIPSFMHCETRGLMGDDALPGLRGEMTHATGGKAEERGS